MASHIDADTNVYLRGWREIEVRVKAGDGVNLTNRNLQLGRQNVQFLGRDIAELPLHGPEFLKHLARSRECEDL
jgi:hypothetical protein